MISNVFNAKPHYTKARNKTGYNRFQPVMNAESGTMSKFCQCVYYDPAVDSQKFTSTDFGLDNIIARGATHMLKPVVMSSVSDMTFADHFQGITLTKTE